ncbi:uncharacterized protein Z518_03947 [Rhinocladiella mackenziei CBS 650.93]|uniref:Aminoglycoside phosphotransferase domain-containing protein n=1 Tax=Rhinocladiella mackenziei CBS 650.93 TaxID=1442369 RepID=A0A0D2H6G5_9EURO|nr:uncharacterized protein Z518_03947 [Rhinocladiella mackenziei CBS 650.93]KIX05973.1 hypothetical protein Z518_03947 [Rhinocladiella mackenziei CBS 650.93]
MAVPQDGLLQLPYYAPEIPFELPTKEDIASPDEVLSELGGRKVVRVGKKFIIKYGQIEQAEAETMIFVRQSTSVPIPAVYAIYRSTENGLLYIVMEYIRGGNLLSLWPVLSKIQKSTICQRLRECLAEKAKVIDSFSNLGTYRSDFYRRNLQKVLQNHRSVFTHGDFQRKNIIIRSREISAMSASSASNDEVIPEANYDVVLIDWEKAGWYPSYWEFCAASWSFRFDDDWPDHLETIIDPCPVKYPWLKTIATELWS